MKTSRKFLTVLVALAALPRLQLAQAGKPATSPAGQWEGESLCTVPASPCHDEHVLYEISRAPSPAGNTSTPKASRDWKIDAYKIVSGEKQFMGTIGCGYDEERKKLSCSGNLKAQDDWEFSIENGTMRGTLVIGAERTLYRKISLKKSPPNGSPGN
jgi:hypothetical protein